MKLMLGSACAEANTESAAVSPFGGGGAFVVLGIGDEANAARIEPAPVLAAASLRRCGRNRLGVRKHETPFVVPQVVERRGVRLVVPPRRHVGRRLAPRHHVVEVLVDGRLALTGRVRVGQITGDRARTTAGHRRSGSRRSRPWRTAACSDVGDHVEAEVPRRSRREGVVDAAPDRVVVGRAAGQPGELDLTERPG